MKSMTYDSFGNIVAESGSAEAEEVSYTGRERESEFGLYYYRARYYDPLTGRFMSIDPLGLAGEDINLYRYVGNNPISFRDAFGLTRGENWWDRLERGYYFATCMGEEATDWWAERYVESRDIFSSGYYLAGGLFASLWTEDTWMGTASALALGGLGQVSGLSAVGPTISEGWTGTIGYLGYRGRNAIDYLRSFRIRVLHHTAHHPFPRLGGRRLPHFQIIVYRSGISRVTFKRCGNW